MTTLTTSIGEIVRGDREVFPPYLYVAYQSTRRRAPRLPLIDVPLTMSELTGPGPAVSAVTPEDADLTRNAGTGGEAIGQRIIVTDRPFTGYYQTIDYAFWQRTDYGHWQRGENIAELTPLTEMKVKAEIARPAEGETVPANTSVRVRGAAWACDVEITKVELSTDGGATWNDTKLLGESKPNAWRFWEFNWKTPAQPGKQTLIARATDSLSRTQPVHRDPNRGTYMINHLLPIEVEVR